MLITDAAPCEKNVTPDQLTLPFIVFRAVKLFAEPPDGKPALVIDDDSPPKSMLVVPAVEFSKLIRVPTDTVADGVGVGVGNEVAEGDGALVGFEVELGDATGVGDTATILNVVQATFGLSPLNQAQRLVPAPPSNVSIPVAPMRVSFPP